MWSTLAVYLHDIDPYAIKLWEGGPIRWYGLSYVAGFVIGYLLILRVTRVGRDAMPRDRAADFAICLAMGVVIGGRLGYVLFYRPDLLWSFSSKLPFWGVLAIHEGGMASHGGILGLIVATGWFAWRHRLQWTHLLDLTAFAAPLGLLFGRLANFVNGELFGRPASPNLPWAVKFPQEMYHWPPQTLQQAQAPLLTALAPPDTVTRHGLESAIPWIINQIQLGNQRVAGIVEPWLTPRHPSQIYQALLEGLLVFIVLAVVWYRPRKPLLIGALFCLTYGIARIIGEQFRQPDAHLGFGLLGLTRGQWLSVFVVLAGAGLTIFALRRDAPLMGGWGAENSESRHPPAEGEGQGD